MGGTKIPDESEYARIQGEFIRRVRFQVQISRALDRALSNPSQDARKQEAIVSALVYCLNELDVAFARVDAPFPPFNDKAYAAARTRSALAAEDR